MTRYLFLIFFPMLLAFSAQAQSSYSTDMKNGRPADFPTPPKTEKSLFFIQRSKNKNTIVYDAILEKDGRYVSSKPIDAYWLRYNSTSERAELTWLQRTFAFGYNAKKDGSKDGYWITLTAYNDRKIHLEKTAKGKPIATLNINGKYCRLEYIWVYALETSTWPDVKHVDLHGVDMVTGKTEVERIYNK